MPKKDTKAKKSDDEQTQPQEAPQEQSKGAQHSKKKGGDDQDYDVIDGELCPFCNTKNLTLVDMKKEIPFFGSCFIFSMDCKNCGYHKSDLEREQDNEPMRFSIDISSEEDMKIRVVKSSMASIKIPHIGSIEAGPASNGYVTNI